MNDKQRAQRLLQWATEQCAKAGGFKGHDACVFHQRGHRNGGYLKVYPILRELGFEKDDNDFWTSNLA